MVETGLAEEVAIEDRTIPRRQQTAHMPGRSSRRQVSLPAPLSRMQCWEYSEVIRSFVSPLSAAGSLPDCQVTPSNELRLIVMLLVAMGHTLNKDLNSAHSRMQGLPNGLRCDLRCRCSSIGTNVKGQAN
jgi:hypothetical protein